MTTILIAFAALLVINVSASAGTYSGGTGTVGDPHEIANLDDLIELSTTSGDWGAYFIQTADIDASDTASGSGFSPIGNNTTFFSGSYDGQGYNISNLYIDRNTTTYVGLFGIVNSGTIKDIHLVDADITGGDNHIGILAGRIEGGATVSNSSSSGTLKGVSRVGGLIGSANGTGTQVTNSCSLAGVTGEGSGSLYTGGLAGEISGSAAIEESYAVGPVTGRHRIGGLVGAMGWNSKVENCYARGDVTLTDNLSWIGGLVGEVWRAKVIKSYSTGYVDYYSNTDHNKEDPVNNWGGLVGVIDTGGNFEDTYNFWDTETSGLTASAMGSGEETSNMKDENTFTDWDFDDIWAITSSQNDGYPYLQWSEGPLAIVLAYFSANVVDGCIEVEWETATEINTLGFYLWRSENRHGEYIHIDESFTPSKALMETMGAIYAYTDCQVKLSGADQYYYKLEELEAGQTQKSNFYGPIGPVSEKAFSVSEHRVSADSKKSSGAGCFVQSLTD